MLSHSVELRCWKKSNVLGIHSLFTCYKNPNKSKTVMKDTAHAQL